MAKAVYTLAMWKVKPGKESGFVLAWKAMGDAFRSLPHPPAGKGTLIHSLSDPTIYCSFGPWANSDDIAAMRADPDAQAAMQQVMNLCTEATPGAYQVIVEM